nr:hypothetical protein [Xanthomonas vasicola]MDO6939614.1 hypothetical protein [Xanthomonas vasicola]
SRRVCLRLPLYSASPKVSCIVVVRCVYAIVAGSRGVVQSFLKSEISGMKWLISKATHTINVTGFATQIDLDSSS